MAACIGAVGVSEPGVPGVDEGGTGEGSVGDEEPHVGGRRGRSVDCVGWGRFWARLLGLWMPVSAVRASGKLLWKSVIVWEARLGARGYGFF
jgi:hypothetical protein